MIIDSDMRSRLAELRINELIAEADRRRLVRSARPARGLLRVRALRLAARGLRVEREVEFKDLSPWPSPRVPRSLPSPPSPPRPR